MKIAKTRGSVSNQTTLSRARSPHGPPTAGVSPYFRGPNVLTDPGFENFVDNSGGWHWPSRYEFTNYVIPKFDITCPSYMTWPDGTCVDTNNTLVSWFQGAGSYNDDMTRYGESWRVSVDDPHSGDYHAVWWLWDTVDGIPPPELCAFSPFIAAPFSCRVKPGDDITWSAYSKVRATTGTPQVSMVLRFYTQNFGFITASQSTFTSLTTSYAQYSHTATTPSGSYYLRACLAFTGGSGNDLPVVVDTAVLGVQ